jgi:hypothetical protein
VIKGYHDERLTPKQMAQDMLMDAMQRVGYQVYEGGIGEEWTDREKALVLEQLEKQFRRIEKYLGYDPGSWKMD